MVLYIKQHINRAILKTFKLLQIWADSVSGYRVGTLFHFNAQFNMFNQAHLRRKRGLKQMGSFKCFYMCKYQVL